MPPRLRSCLPLLVAWLAPVHGLGLPLSSRKPGTFCDFKGRRVGFGSVKSVRVPLAGATIPELQEYLTPERVATAMWDTMMCHVIMKNAEIRAFGAKAKATLVKAILDGGGKVPPEYM